MTFRNIVIAIAIVTALLVLLFGRLAWMRAGTTISFLACILALVALAGRAATEATGECKQPPSKGGDDVTALGTTDQPHSSASSIAETGDSGNSAQSDRGLQQLDGGRLTLDLDHALTYGQDGEELPTVESGTGSDPQILQFSKLTALLIEELVDERAWTDLGPADVSQYAVSRLFEILTSAGVELIESTDVYDPRKHRLDGRPLTVSGQDVSIVVPGLLYGGRVVLKARVVRKV